MTCVSSLASLLSLGHTRPASRAHSGTAKTPLRGAWWEDLLPFSGPTLLLVCLPASSGSLSPYTSAHRPESAGQIWPGECLQPIPTLAGDCQPHHRGDSAETCPSPVPSLSPEAPPSAQGLLQALVLPDPALGLPPPSPGAPLSGPGAAPGPHLPLPLSSSTFRGQKW